ncbi:MAG: aspartate aminotransferase family protein [Caldilinea sp.]|nr:aspartate aminotransferase family protein [Caldilineaceae bacterium]MCO5213072.1 aspartate aminotransferase family protein [Caldilinea sp.]MCW5843111.1 aspartate aminotransferase family protein [Caldilinea sp.]
MIERSRIQALLRAEEARFVETHPQSQALFARARQSLLGGVPMPWMVRWAGPFPVFVAEGKGAHFTDVDGHDYIDFCLGDTGAMTGHAPDATIQAMTAQLHKGLTFMLPAEDAIWVGEELARRFGLPSWQIAMTATDANRFAIRLARHITRRPKVLVYNYCYHGTVDEAFIALDAAGQPGPRPGNIGPPVNPTATTKVIEFNDIPALEAALAPGDVACVLAEPVMTNIGIIHPEPGYHDALREITRRTGTLLIIDETHTICTGPGGYSAAHGLAPDMLVIGKPIGGGMPVAAYGMSEAVAAQVRERIARDEADTGGIGGTLSGNALALAATRATLEHVLTEEYYARSIPLADRFLAGVQEVIADFGVPWTVQRLGNRAEYWFRPTPARNGGEAAAAIDADLDRLMHLWALNRGILMTPFHNMALIAPQTTAADVEQHTAVFREAVAALTCT